ncbi:MAG: pyroglutamyl-peptidase I [Planctomycetes bacterium]|nr:pyroglutamyl-peptidase I [Planctomycetota bacterium]MCB9934813.1 pyroglutamyl-peptidase I [Planctomycetota bacterium]
MSLRRVLLSGFEPFGDFASNPSWDALVYARDEGLFEAGVRLARIPVAYEHAWNVFEKAAIEYEPDAAISFGVYGSPRDSESFRRANGLEGSAPLRAICIETVARNRDGAGKPDNTGRERGREPIVPDAPPTLPASFPARAMRQALNEAGFDAELSEDAGGYLCNHLFFRASHSFGAGIPYGFVHVPPVDSMGGALSIAELARAIAIMVNVVARHE